MMKKVVSSARLTGAHVNMKAPPVLLQGENYCTNEFDSISMHNKDLVLTGEGGKIWLTTFRIILRFYETGEFYIANANVLKIEKGMTQTYETFTIYSRDLQVFTFGIPIVDKRKKELSKAMNSQFFPKSNRNLFCYSPTKQYNFKGWEIYNIETEFNRQGINFAHWKISKLNADFQLTETYPPNLIIPTSFPENYWCSLSSSRYHGRLTALTWGGPTGPYIFRTAALNAKESDEITGLNSVQMVKGEEEQLFKVIHQLSSNDIVIMFDTRMKGDFDTQLYQGTIAEKGSIQCLGIPSDSQVANSLKSLISLCTSEEPIKSASSWLEMLDQTKWIDFIQRTISSSYTVAKKVHSESQTVIIQNERGDNFVSIVCALMQIFIDPYYRTIPGFCVLIEKDFISFGHKFGNFVKKKEEDSQSAIFLFFLSCVWQFIHQRPFCFEFTDALLLHLIDCVYSCQFGTFLYTCEKEKHTGSFPSKTPSIWSDIMDSSATYRNPYFQETKGFLEINTEKNVLRLWNEFFLRFKCKPSLDKMNRAAQTSLYKGVQILELSSVKIPYLLTQSWDLFYFIKELNLNNNLICRFPLEILFFRELKKLSLESNQIPLIPDEFLDLLTRTIKTLQELNLNYNQIEFLSPSICNFSTLQSLKLRNNLITELPNLSTLTNLTELDIGANPINSIPPEVLRMQTLRRLSVISTNLKTIPNDIASLVNLEYLDIGCNKIESLPPQFSQLTNLIYLNISSNEFPSIPDVIFTYTKLNILLLSDLRLTEIPNAITNLTNLEYLNLSKNDFTKFPISLLQLVNLKSLDLENNSLTSIPLYIYNLSQLVELYLQHNQLEHLTPGIGNLTKLRVLNVRFNHLRTLPGTIGFMDSLLQSGSFYYDNNEYTTKLEKYDYTELFTKLRLKLTADVRCYRMKLMLVGQENVGKTSILRCISDYRKKVNSEKNILDKGGKINSNDQKLYKATGLTSLSTDGIDIGDLEYIMKMPSNNPNNKREKIKINISAWDFAGQEIYYTTHQFFLSEKAIYLLVWDISKQEENSRVEYWLKSISAKAKNAPIIVVGTHSDHPKCTREYLFETITAFNQKYLKQYPSIVDVIPASCSTGDGVKMVDLHIQSILTSIREDMGKPVPARYYQLEDLIKEEGLKKSRESVPPVVSWEEFQTFGKICATTEDLPEAAAFLHRLGSLNYFPKMPKLRDIYVLHPQWLVDVMCSVITTKHAFVKGGVLEHSSLKQIWRPPTFPEDLHQTLLNLLENFEISFYLRSTAQANDLYTGRSLVPSLLPEERPPQLDEKWSAWPMENQHQYSRRYRFSFIPHGFVSRYLIRLVCLCEPTIIWRHGVFLENEKEGYSILVELQPARKQLDITIRGEGGSKMAQLIIDSLNSLIEGWYNLIPDIQIPCIHCVKRKDFDPHIFNMEECEQQAIEGKSFVKCRNIRAVRLDELAPDVAMSHVASCKLNFRELTISNQIGEGGFALVYKGTYQGKAVAIKKIKFGSQNGPSLDDTTELQAFAEFRREVWIMSGLVHQNLVQLVGFTMDPFCIVSEFMYYGDLYTLIHDESKTLSWGYRWRCAIDMAKGMAFLHTTTPPIVHRDLKSPNVLMCSLDERAEAVAKIADFGLSQVLASTTQGRSVANPVWLAPEIMRNEEYTEKVDVYSFGVMMWELAARKDFFGDIKFMSALENRIIEGDRPPIPIDTPIEFADLIRLCWHNNPDRRPSFTDIVEQLAAGIKKYHPNLHSIAITEKEVKIIRPKDENVSEKKVRTQEEIEREKKEIEEARKELARREMEKYARLVTPLHNSSIQCMIYVPAGPQTPSQIWTGTSEGLITIWNLDGSQSSTINAHSKSIYCMAYHTDSIWTSSAESVIRIYTKQGRLKKELKLPNYAVLCFAAVDKQLWGGTTDSHVQIFDPKGCKSKKRIKVIENGPVCCLFSEYSFQKVWVGTDFPDKYIVRLSMKGKPLDYIIGHSSKVNCIIEADNLIWSSSNDRTIRVWSPDTADCLKILHAHSGPVYSLSTSSEFVWSASWDKSIIIWDAKCQAFMKEYEAHKDAVSSVIHLPNSTCWSGSWDRSILIWDPNVTKF